MLYIVAIWVYVSQGNRLAVLVRAFIMLLYVRVSYSTYYAIFKSQKGSVKATPLCSYVLDASAIWHPTV